MNTVKSQQGLSAESLADRAYNLIEEMIVTLALPPGKVFSEAELHQALNIGRTPVREALQRLAYDRLVVAIPRRGMMVTDINIGEQLTLLETRRVLDKLVAARSARLATPEQRTALRECAPTMVAAAKENDLPEFLRKDRFCDEILATACRNPFAIQALAPLHAHCRRFWYYYQNDGDLKTVAQLHADLMAAVASGEENHAEAASDALIDYLSEFTRTTLLNA